MFPTLVSADGMAPDTEIADAEHSLVDTPDGSDAVTRGTLGPPADRLLQAVEAASTPAPLVDGVSPAVELAVGELARLVAAGSRDEAEALESIARVAGRLAALHRAPAARHALDEDPPVPAAGSWSLSNGMLNVVLGEN